VSDGWNRDEFEALDQSDPLRHLRDEFVLDDGLIYLDGNSLGALPRATVARLRQVVEQEWGQGLIRSWNDAAWIEAPQRIGDKIARLIGAGDGEVIVTDSTSIALVKALCAGIDARPGRTVILTEDANFPTDLYVAGGVAELLGSRVVVRIMKREELFRPLADDVAVVMLTHVDFRTGAMHDMRAISAAAHDAGALMLWDLSHSAGAVPLSCMDDGADLAVGCGYKYLNGGPGAPAFLLVSRTLQEAARNPLPGWMGHAAPFDFSNDYAAAEGIRRFLTGTPPMLSLLALESAIDLWLGVDMAAVREKSVALTELFIHGVASMCGDAMELLSPRDPADRGSQVSLRHADGYGVIQALAAAGVIGDFRAPDICRFGFTPLYTRYVDVFDTVERLSRVIESGAYREPRYNVRATVT
jgi:kynureninase